MFKFLVFAAAVYGAQAGLIKNLHDRAHYEGKFIDYVRNHKMELNFSGKEFVQRLQIYSDNLDKIEVHNKGDSSYKLGENAFTHMTWSEFREHFNIGLALPNLRKGSGAYATAKTGNADAIDWVEKGSVTNVKNQGGCGSCWAFSTTGAIEGAYQQKTGSLKEFSEQQLVDCDQVDAGCNGGLMDQAFDWVKGNGGLCSEADYPYTSGDSAAAGQCSSSCAVDSASAPTGFVDVKPKDVGALETALNVGPVSVAVAVNSNFQMYTSGVFDGRCGFQLNHGVLTVGYGTDAGQDFWKVKNSWGADWGEDGYIRLVKDSSDECKIMDAASYPTL